MRSSLPSPVYLLTPSLCSSATGTGTWPLLRTETWLTGAASEGSWRKKAPFSSQTDSEVIAHLIARSGLNDTREALLSAALLKRFSLVIMTPEALYGIRDPHGIRPSLGKLPPAMPWRRKPCALIQWARNRPRHFAGRNSDHRQKRFKFRALVRKKKNRHYAFLNMFILRGRTATSSGATCTWCGSVSDAAWQRNTRWRRI